MGSEMCIRDSLYARYVSYKINCTQGKYNDFHNGSTRLFYIILNGRRKKTLTTLFGAIFNENLLLQQQDIRGVKDPMG